MREEAEARGLSLAAAVVRELSSLRRTRPGGDDRGWHTTDPRIVLYAGGIPLLVDGELVGGIVASGGTTAEDDERFVAAAAGLGFE